MHNKFKKSVLNQHDTVVSIKKSMQGIAVIGYTALAFSTSAWAVDTQQIDQLTQQWINIDKQNAMLQQTWRTQKPILEQQLSLLKEEKSQLMQLLSTDNSNQAAVDIKRTELLEQQNLLEQNQNALAEQLTILNKQLLHLSDMLPPPLINAWQKEEQALGVDPSASVQLQVALAKLSKLNEFEKRISVIEMPLTSPNGNEILVKQFYLGVSQAWFTSANGEYRGWGQASNTGWQWHFDQQLNAEEIQLAIAIFEKKQQADFVALPVLLKTNTVKASTDKANDNKNSQGAAL